MQQLQGSTAGPIDYYLDMSYMLNSTSTDIETPRPLAVHITLTILLVIIISFAIIGNILVFLTILRCAKIRKQISSVFLFNLALTDIGCAVLVMPFSLVSMWKEAWIFGDIWCDGVCFFNYCFIIVSMATLAFISLDRYMFVVHPLRYEPLVKRKRAIVCCCLGWLVGVIFGAAPPLARWVWYDNGEIICAIDWESDQSGVVAYTITAFIFCFMFPMLVMCLAYLHIYKVAKRHAVKIAQSAGHNRSSNQICGGGRLTNARVNRANRYNTKAIKTILIMILAYAICNTPFSLTKLLKVVYSDNEAVPKSMSTLASWLGYVTPCCNPIIYAINREEFRKAFYKILCLKSHKESPYNSYSERATFNLTSYKSQEPNRIYSTMSPVIKMVTLNQSHIPDVVKREAEDHPARHTLAKREAEDHPARHTLDQPRASVSQIAVALPGTPETRHDDQMFPGDFGHVIDD